MRRVGEKKNCKICGFIAKPGGIGSHMRLFHGIKVKVLVHHISDISGHTSDISGRVSEISGLSERVQRPSDFVRKRSEKVIETRIEPAVRHLTEAEIEEVLSGIIMPSISRYKTGSLSEAESKDLARTAKEMGKTIDEYMKDLEERVKNMPPAIARGFE